MTKTFCALKLGVVLNVTSTIRFQRSELPCQFAVICSKEIFPFVYVFLLLCAAPVYGINFESGSHFKYYLLGMLIPKCIHRCFCLYIQIMSGRKARGVTFTACFSLLSLTRLCSILSSDTCFPLFCS